MKIQAKITISIIIFFTLLKFTLAQTDIRGSIHETNKTVDIKTNEDYIEGINSELDLDNTMDVFSRVFNSLNKVVKVYPTENYYYYQFETRGLTIKGNIALFADKRDEGKINFAYEETNNISGVEITKKQGVAELDQKNGLIVRKINEFEYEVVFKNKSVRFVLNQLEIQPSDPNCLRPEEICIGPSYDESGLQFYLIFNKRMNYFFWILNEEKNVPESFANLVDNVIIGRRTEFVFFEDKEMNRKILFGVNYQNMYKNNWFDGPFDQLPDNYIKNNMIDLKRYLENAYPEYAGQIDKYGHFLKEDDTRVAISPYSAYNSYIDVVKVYYACKNSSITPSEFIFNLTKERYFDVQE